LADGAHAARLQPQQADPGNPCGHRDERRKSARQASFDAHKDRDRHQSDGKGDPGRRGRTFDDSENVVEERALSN